MPRYAYQKPVNRLYSYNTKYMTNYYKPLTQYIESKKDVVEMKKDTIERGTRAPSEQPGHQSLAERLKTYPMDGSIYRARASSVPPSRRQVFDTEEDLNPKVSMAAVLGESAGRRARARPMSTYEMSGGDEVFSDEPRYVPIWMKHPYRLPVEDVKVPPHESSIWPESVPHFNLVSSYDTMIGYLGLKR